MIALAVALPGPVRRRSSTESTLTSASIFCSPIGAKAVSGGEGTEDDLLPISPAQISSTSLAQAFFMRRLSSSGSSFKCLYFSGQISPFYTSL